jgi:hypothetical protein
MQSPGSGVLRPLLMACGVAVSTVPALAATPTFTVVATNVTLPANGNAGTSQFTLTSVNGYSGRLVVSSEYSGGDMNAKPPNGGIHTAPLYTLKANSTVNGTLTFFPYGKVVPIAADSRRAGRPIPAPVVGLAVVFCFVFRRRMRAAGARWLGIVLLGVIGVAVVASCGGNGLSGMYPFTVTATDTVSNTSVSTSITVTVP